MKTARAMHLLMHTEAYITFQVVKRAWLITPAVGKKLFLSNTWV